MLRCGVAVRKVSILSQINHFSQMANRIVAKNQTASENSPEHNPLNLQLNTRIVENRLTNEETVVVDNFKDKFKLVYQSLYSRYNEIVGFTEIDAAYRKVTELQELLLQIQNERTVLQLQISHVRNDLTTLQAEIHEHKRGETKYLELLRREFDVIQKKNQLEEKLSILDKKERDMFSHLQSRINVLHEKSRTNTKQWGIISTIIGALLGIIGTSISAYFRNNDIRNIQKSIQDQINSITSDTQQMMTGYNKMMGYLENYHKTLSSQVPDVPKVISDREGWGSYLKRKTVSVYKWCTFHKSS